MVGVGGTRLTYRRIPCVVSVLKPTYLYLLLRSFGTTSIAFSPSAFFFIFWMKCYSPLSHNEQRIVTCRVAVCKSIMNSFNINMTASQAKLLA